MRSFMYLVEIILVGLLLISYLYYLRVPTNIEKTLDLFEKKYQLDTLAISTTNINRLDLEELFKIYYLIFSDKLKDFSQNLEKLDVINIDIIGVDCVAFLYPFPILDTYNYFHGNYVNFLIYNIDGILCKNLTVSKDWKMLKIDNLPSQNISLYLENVFNLSLLDPYSIFVFDDIGNELKIAGIAFDFLYLNITDIHFNSSIHKLPIYVIFRIKENLNIENLTYLSGRYAIFNNNPGVAVSFSIKKSNWITIYLSDKCMTKRDLVIKYSIFPSLKFKREISNEIQKEKCKGSYNISYFKENFLEKFDDLKLTKLSFVEDPLKSEHEVIIYLNDGLNFALLKLYGS